MEGGIQIPVCAPNFCSIRLKKTGRDVIELHSVSFATAPRPLAESQEDSRPLIDSAPWREIEAVFTCLSAADCSELLTLSK
jgi:hypothetical protein